MAGGRRAGFAEALCSEWTKLWSVRSTRWTLVAAALVIPVFAVIVSATGSLQPDDTILGGSLTGAVPGQLFAAALGAMAITGEYRSGTIRTTFTALPRRWTVLAAKATVVAAVLFAVTLPSAVAGFLIGAATLDGDKYATGDAWPAVLGIGIAMVAIGLLGLAVGTAVRHSVGAIAAVAALILVPSLVGPLFGTFERWAGGASPTGALQKLTQTADASPEAVGSLGAWPSLGVVAVYTVLLMAGSGWRLTKRDA